MKQQAQGQKSRLQAVVKARADAQVHIISEIGRRLGRLEKVGAQDIAMKLIVVLQRLAQSAALRPFLPMDTSQIINRVRGGLSGRSSEEEGA